MKRLSLLVKGGLLLGAVWLLAGCSSLIPVTDGGNLTPTPNATLLSIAQMLTQTAAAPTITLTPFWTPTVTPTQTPTPPIAGSEALPGRMGQPVERQGLALTVLKQQTLAQVGKLKPKDGQSYLDVEVILANHAEQALEYSPLLFQLQSNGQDIPPVNDAVAPRLLSGELEPGGWVRGHVAFAAPKETGGYTLSYAQNNPPSLWVDLSQPALSSASPPAKGSAIPEGKLPGVGQQEESSGVALTIHTVRTSQREGGVKVDKGQVFVVLDVSIENTNRAMEPFNVEYFKARDADGYEYLPTVIPSEELIQAGSLGRGKQVRGLVVFSIPEQAARLMVIYQPQVLSGDYKEIRLEVPVPGK